MYSGCEYEQHEATSSQKNEKDNFFGRSRSDLMVLNTRYAQQPVQDRPNIHKQWLTEEHQYTDALASNQFA